MVAPCGLESITINPLVSMSGSTGGGGSGASGVGDGDGAPGGEVDVPAMGGVPGVAPGAAGAPGGGAPGAGAPSAGGGAATGGGGGGASSCAITSRRSLTCAASLAFG